MKKVKNYISGGIALYLLLCFSAATLPLDFFHQHEAATQTVVCKSPNGQHCTHKSHVLNKQRFCWLCTTQVDKVFTIEPMMGSNLKQQVPTTHQIRYSLKTYQAAIRNTSLRGPPRV